MGLFNWYSKRKAEKLRQEQEALDKDRLYLENLVRETREASRRAAERRRQEDIAWYYDRMNEDVTPVKTSVTVVQRKPLYNDEESSSGLGSWVVAATIAEAISVADGNSSNDDNYGSSNDSSDFSSAFSGGESGGAGGGDSW